jgi:hypothetical protein
MGSIGEISMTNPKSKTATTAVTLTNTLPLDATGVEAMPEVSENNGTDNVPLEDESTDAIVIIETTDGADDSTSLNSVVADKAQLSTRTIDAPKPTYSAQQDAALRRFVAVPFAERDYMLLIMTAIQHFDYRVPTDTLYADIQNMFDEAGMPKMKTGTNYKELLNGLEQLGFIESGSILDGNIRFDSYYLTDIGASFQALDYSQSVTPRVLYIVERYLRSSRTMTPGVVLSLSELVARIISTQTVQLSAHMQLFTPKGVHEVVLQTIAKRFEADELHFDVGANTVSILQSLDPGRGVKSLDIWVI